MSLFRYPGGKTKLLKPILAKLNMVGENCEEYREPFFGGGSVGCHVPYQRLWINDKDIGLACLWTALIKGYEDELCALVERFEPSVDAYLRFKEELLHLEDVWPIPDGQIRTVVNIGFKKLAIHQLSYSGLGTKSGGPLGGMTQTSAYKVDCRWNPSRICQKMRTLAATWRGKIFRHASCTMLDFQHLIEDGQSSALIYLDPPYFVKGNDLYQCGFTQDDHIRLAECLRRTEHKWVLSYDDAPEIRDLYGWASMESVDVNYSITARKTEAGRVSTTKPELLIWR